MSASSAASRNVPLVLLGAGSDAAHTETDPIGAVDELSGPFEDDEDAEDVEGVEGVEEDLDDHWHFPSLPSDDQEKLRLSLQRRIGVYLKRGTPRVVITDNLHTMLSIKRGDDVWTFRLHHMFLDAPPIILRSVARYAENHDDQASKMVRRFIDANDDRIRRRARPRSITIDVQGKYYNLQEIFDQLNAQYFDGRIEARITWGQRGRRRRARESIKLGSYTVEDKLIRIHPVLDAKDVPRYFVAWVVYHEMLHEIHDMPIVGGRRIYHTPAFRQQEAEFEHYALAVAWERTQIHRLLTR